MIYSGLVRSYKNLLLPTYPPTYLCSLHPLDVSVFVCSAHRFQHPFQVFVSLEVENRDLMMVGNANRLTSTPCLRGCLRTRDHSIWGPTNHKGYVCFEIVPQDDEGIAPHQLLDIPIEGMPCGMVGLRYHLTHRIRVFWPQDLLPGTPLGKCDISSLSTSTTQNPPLHLQETCQLSHNLQNKIRSSPAPHSSIGFHAKPRFPSLYPTIYMMAV